ncbi:MAG: hypothetical protein ACI3ZP_01270 [Candidatus Cryptobacteroides sp.]
MKTIEDRAKECIPDAFDERYSAGFYQGYIVGATEQKEVDDEQLTERFQKALNGQKWDIIDNACNWLKARNVLTDASLEGFRKAMEEEI